jgi:hypothetical protein
MDRALGRISGEVGRNLADLQHLRSPVWRTDLL